MNNLTPEEQDKIYTEEKFRQEVRIQLWRERIASLLPRLRHRISSKPGDIRMETNSAAKYPENGVGLDAELSDATIIPYLPLEWQKEIASLASGIAIALMLGYFVGIIRHQPDIYTLGRTDNRTLVVIAFFLSLFGSSFCLSGVCWLLRHSQRRFALLVIAWGGITSAFFVSLRAGIAAVISNCLGLMYGSQAGNFEIDTREQWTYWLWGSVILWRWHGVCTGMAFPKYNHQSPKRCLPD